MSIERRFDVSLIAGLALREKQIQQSYRPIIGVHKWFARRPGTLFRGLLLAEFGQERLEDLFFRPNDLTGLRIADPFMGGGTPLIEANRVGCDVEGFDINPMSAWIVREEIEPLDIAAYERAAGALIAALRDEIGRHYRTSCPRYGDPDVPVKSFLWVKVLDCEACGEPFDLFPGYLLAENRRHPKNVLVCPACGDLAEVEDRKRPGSCASCASALRRDGPARRGRCECPRCGHANAYPGRVRGPLAHRLFAIEYHNPHRRAEHKGRFFKRPDAGDLARASDAAHRWAELSPRFVPDEPIPPGDETGRLHRWGYARYRELFNPRQLLGLELSCRLIAGIEDARIRRALATNLSDLLRYQNMLCRYDTMALKALDIFSVHGFPVGLVQCESSFTGIVNDTGTNVGSGGWSNIVDKYLKAKRYCDAPYEVRRIGSRNVRVPVVGERIGESREARGRRTSIRCGSATESDLAPHSLDAVFTDPPYFGNVQYGELMDFCYVWLRRLVGNDAEGFHHPSTRSPDELTGNVTQARGLEHFTEGLSTVYSRMSRALKPGAPLVFTYHHNKLDTSERVRSRGRDESGPRPRPFGGRRAARPILACLTPGRRAGPFPEIRRSGGCRGQGGAAVFGPALRRSVGADLDLLLWIAFVELLETRGRSRVRPEWIPYPHHVPCPYAGYHRVEIRQRTPFRWPVAFAARGRRQDGMTEAAQPRVFVDGNNVMGSRPDGWWRDRAEAARRLVAEIAPLARARGNVWTIVFDGPVPGGVVPLRECLAVVHTGHGGRDGADDRIVELVEAIPDRAPALVYTSDAGLRARVSALGAEVAGARALLEEIAAMRGTMEPRDSSGALASRGKGQA